MAFFEGIWSSFMFMFEQFYVYVRTIFGYPRVSSTRVKPTEEYDYLFQIYLGPFDFLNQSLQMMLAPNSFPNREILGTYGLITHTVDGKVVKLQFRNCRESKYYAQALVLVYDTANRASFYEMGHWLENNRNSSEKYKILMGKREFNQERQVDFEEGEDFAKRNNMEHFFEVSVQDEENVEGAMRTMAEDLTRRFGDKTLVP